MSKRKPAETLVQEPEADEVLRPQRMQQLMLSSPADIVIAGGAAGAGKTMGLFLESLRNIHVPGFGAVIFRRTYPEITNEGGMWDESGRIFPQFGGVPKETTCEWEFPEKTRVRFAHLAHENDRFAWNGAQVPLICFDQLELFTELQFWYMLSRNRSMCGVRPYLRATCNPVTNDDPIGGWLNKLIGWWIDQDTGYPIAERSGVLRWFVRRGDMLEWADTAEVLTKKYPGSLPKSLTFIQGKLEDNPILMAADPGYLANLEALPLVERERLRGGNWNIKPSAGKVFNRAWFEIVGAAPVEGAKARAWDKAGTAGGGDWSAGVKLLRGEDGIYYVEDVKRGQWSSARRDKIIKQTAQLDGHGVHVVLEQEPGSGGKQSAEISVRELEGYRTVIDKVTGDKVTRAGPLASYCEAGNVKLVRGPWNQAFIDELHAFDGSDGGTDDQVDGASGAFNYLAAKAQGFDPFTISWSRSTNRLSGERYRDPRESDETLVVRSDRGDERVANLERAHDVEDESHRAECRACRAEWRHRV